MYVSIYMFCQLQKSVNLGKKKKFKKKSLLAVVCEVEEPLVLRERRTFGALSQEGFAHVGSRTQCAPQPSLECRTPAI